MYIQPGTQVTLTGGSYRGQGMQGTEGVLVKEYQPFNAPKDGWDGFITIRTADNNIRVKTTSHNYAPYVNLGDGETMIEEAPVVVAEKTDEERIAEIAERFDILDEMAQASIDGIVRGMVVTGPPGVGKSYGVEKILEKNSMFDKLAGNTIKFGTEKGAASAIGLYQLLYRYADPGSVLVLDDCDSILWDEVSLNLLKAALDSSTKRMISWNTESSALRREGVPEKFEFCGSVIFITNLKFDKVKGKIKDHLEAILSRCHYLDLTLDTMHDKMLRVKQIVGDGMLNTYNFGKAGEEEVVNFMESNTDRLREVSLRMVTKLADLKKMSEHRWMTLAENTCIKRG
jgi:hypothetical protein|tara:strand:+ start:109 stop:1137 length:1029 start_codon:yes stop_codon:yes gene_type:complete